MNKWLEILIGLVLLVAVIYIAGMNLFGFGIAALTVLQGGIIWCVALIGFLLVVLGIMDLKE